MRTVTNARLSWKSTISKSSSADREIVVTVSVPLRRSVDIPGKATPLTEAVLTVTSSDSGDSGAMLVLVPQQVHAHLSAVGEVQGLARHIRTMVLGPIHSPVAILCHHAGISGTMVFVDGDCSGAIGADNAHVVSHAVSTGIAEPKATMLHIGAVSEVNMVHNPIQTTVVIGAFLVFNESAVVQVSVDSDRVLAVVQRGHVLGGHFVVEDQAKVRIHEPVRSEQVM